MTRVAIVGCAGRMGRALVTEVHAADDLELVAASEQPGSPAVGQDAGSLAGLGPLGVCITSSPSELLEACELVIDFTTPESTAALAPAAADRGVSLLIGTTGLGAGHEAAVRAAAERVPVIWAPNTSVGVNVLFRIAGETARLLGPDYGLEIVEAHHRHKKDAPSGTALRLAEILAASTPEVGPLAERICHGRSGLQPRRPGEIGVHAVRGGDVAGEHTVWYCGEGERLELTIRTSGRQTLARGAIRGVRWLVGRSPGLYDMQDVLGLRES